MRLFFLFTFFPKKTKSLPYQTFTCEWSHEGKPLYRHNLGELRHRILSVFLLNPARLSRTEIHGGYDMKHGKNTKRKTNKKEKNNNIKCFNICSIICFPVCDDVFAHLCSYSVSKALLKKHTVTVGGQSWRRPSWICTTGGTRAEL